MTFYSGFLDDFLVSLLIYVFHHVLLLQINTSQMTDVYFFFVCVLVVICVCVWVCGRESEPNGVCPAEVTPSESVVSVKQVAEYFVVI